MKLNLSEQVIVSLLKDNKLVEANTLFTKGVNGQSPSFMKIAKHFVERGNKIYAEFFVTTGIGGNKVTILHLAEGYAFGGHRALAESCVTTGIGGNKATVNYVAYGYAMGGHGARAEACVTTGIGGNKATVKDVANGYARSGHRALAEKLKKNFPREDERAAPVPALSSKDGSGRTKKRKGNHGEALSSADARDSDVIFVKLVKKKQTPLAALLSAVEVKKESAIEK